jgi:hypothetical protein
LLKFFRINHRDEQIGKQREGDEADNNVFHKSLEFFAPVGVKLARHKKQGDDGDENKINHRFCFQIAGAMCRSRLPIELNCVRSCPHHDAIPGKRLIKRWLVGVKKVLRNNLPNKSLTAGHRNQPQNAAGLNRINTA